MKKDLVKEADLNDQSIISNDKNLIKHNKAAQKSVIIVNETAAELMADKIDKQKKEEKLVEDIKDANNNAEVIAAATEAAKEKVQEIKNRDT